MKNTIKKFLAITQLFAVCFAISISQASAQTAGATAAIDEGPYLILISADGFRYDYTQKFQTKNLLQLSAQGVVAERVIPSYPSSTHPNHYSIITGLYPGHTGIMGNSFYQKAVDQKTIVPYNKEQKYWFNSKDIFTLANEQKMITANINWPQAKTITSGLDLVLNQKGFKDPGTEGKVAVIKKWLNQPVNTRPHLITLYFGDTDHAGHSSGTESETTKQAATDIDEAIGEIVAAVKETGLPVNFILVSDHGMINNEKTPITNVSSAIDTLKFVVNNQNALVNIYAKHTTTDAEITREYNKLKADEKGNYKIYLNAAFPAHLHYGGIDDKYKRAGDIIMVPEPPKSFNRKPGSGMHGFDPNLVKEMGATFIAWGPAFKKGVTIPPFENVEVYKLMTRVLGLSADKKDGKDLLGELVLK